MKDFKYLTIFNSLSRKFRISLCQLSKIILLFQIVTSNFACATKNPDIEAPVAAALSPSQLVKETTETQIRVIDLDLIRQMPHLREHGGSLLLSRGREQYVLPGMSTSQKLTTYTLVSAIFLRASNDEAIYRSVAFAAPVRLFRTDNLDFRLARVAFAKQPQEHEAKVSLEFTDAKSSYQYQIEFSVRADQSGLFIHQRGDNPQSLLVAFNAAGQTPITSRIDEHDVLALVDADYSVAVVQKQAPFQQISGDWYAKTKQANAKSTTILIPAVRSALGLATRFAKTQHESAPKVAVHATQESHVTNQMARSLSLYSADGRLLDLVNLLPGSSITVALATPGDVIIKDNFSGLTTPVSVPAATPQDQQPLIVTLPPRPLGSLKIKTATNGKTAAGFIAIEADSPNFTRAAALPGTLPTNLYLSRNGLRTNQWPVDLLLPAGHYRVRIRDLQQGISCTLPVNVAADQPMTLTCTDPIPESITRSFSQERSYLRLNSGDRLVERGTGQALIVYGLDTKTKQTLVEQLKDKVSDRWFETLRTELSKQTNIHIEMQCPAAGIERATYIKFMRLLKPQTYLLFDCALVGQHTSMDELYFELQRQVAHTSIPLNAYSDTSTADSAAIETPKIAANRDRSGRILNIAADLKLYVEPGFRPIKIVAYGDSGIVSETSISAPGTDVLNMTIPGKNQSWLRFELHGVKDFSRNDKDAPTKGAEMVLGTTTYLPLDPKSVPHSSR